MWVRYRGFLSWGRPLRAVSPSVANKGFFLLSFRAARQEVPDSPVGRPLCQLMDCPVKKNCVSCISLPAPRLISFLWLKSWAFTLKAVPGSISFCSLEEARNNVQRHCPTAGSFQTASGSERWRAHRGYVLPQHLQKPFQIFFSARDRAVFPGRIPLSRKSLHAFSSRYRRTVSWWLAPRCVQPCPKGSAHIKAACKCLPPRTPIESSMRGR